MPIEAHMSSVVTEEKKKIKPEYKCKYCEKVYRKPCKVIEHERTHTGERPFLCTFEGCDKSYFKPSHLTVHKRSHSNIKDYKCTVEGCEAYFTTNQHLKRHETTHSTGAAHKCDFPDCTAAFVKRFQLRWHKAAHEKGSHLCDKCSTAFDSLPALEKHISRVHDNPIIYQCQSCDRHFVKWSELRKHTSEDHPAVCTICNRTYSRRSNLKIHIKEKHMEPQAIKCEWPGCSSVLTTKRSYKMHIVHTHEQDTRYKCKTCNKGFAYKSLLAQHLTKSHLPKKEKKFSLKRKPPILEQLTGHNHYKQQKTLLSCPFESCRFQFANTYLLRRHLESEIHANDVKSFQLTVLENNEMTTMA